MRHPHSVFICMHASWMQYVERFDEILSENIYCVSAVDVNISRGSIHIARYYIVYMIFYARKEIYLSYPHIYPHRYTEFHNNNNKVQI